jgi:hypothetical protein
MTYPEWMAARQLLMEEHLGVHLRQRVHDEDATFKKTKARVSR